MGVYVLTKKMYHRLILDTVCVMAVPWEYACLVLVFVKHVVYEGTSCFEQINFTTEDCFTKHANITTIYKDN